MSSGGKGLTEDVTGHSPSANSTTSTAPYRHVVCSWQDNNILTQTRLLRPLRRQTKVQPISGVVGDEQDGALLRRRQPHRRKNLLGARRGEDITTRHSGQQAFTNKAAPSRLMARATATDDAHGRRIIAAVGDDTLWLIEYQVRVSIHQSS